MILKNREEETYIIIHGKTTEETIGTIFYNQS